MARSKKRDAWVAHIRVCVPIDATDTSTINRAQQKVREIANLIPGSTVEVTHAGFGRMEIGAMTPAEAHAAVRAAADKVVTAPEPEPEIPASLRRVPRPAPNGPTDPYSGRSPMDPSGDGSFRGPDGAA